ncbi:MAG: hypothetical protein XD53_0335 [Petrotoga mobilis]|nr:MAG: hypothetical protein XD53_0335 [Petrotoga mobilis]
MIIDSNVIIPLTISIVVMGIYKTKFSLFIIISPGSLPSFILNANINPMITNKIPIVMNTIAIVLICSQKTTAAD